MSLTMRPTIQTAAVDGFALLASGATALLTTMLVGLGTPVPQDMDDAQRSDTGLERPAQPMIVVESGLMNRLMSMS